MALLLALLVSSCGDDDNSSTSDGAEAPVEDAQTDEDESSGSVSGLDGGVGDFTPGDRSFRIVNLSEQAIDVYGFTTGLVEHYEIELGVEPDEITEYLAPPEDGKLVLFEAGATDVTEFGADNLGEFSESSFEENGNRHTIVMGTSPETGELDLFELWEEHDGSNPSGNALVSAAADGNATVIMMTATTDGDSFKPSDPGGTTCLSPRDAGEENIFIGGNQLIEYDVAPPTFTFDLHSFDDGDLKCEEAPALSGGSVEVAAGERVLAVIDERSGSPELVALPLS